MHSEIKLKLQYNEKYYTCKDIVHFIENTTVH